MKKSVLIEGSLLMGHTRRPIRTYWNIHPWPYAILVSRDGLFFSILICWKSNPKVKNYQILLYTLKIFSSLMFNYIWSKSKSWNRCTITKFIRLNKIRITVKTLDVLDISLHIKVTVYSLSKIFDKEKGIMTCNNRLLVYVLAKGIPAQVILI